MLKNCFQVLVQLAETILRNKYLSQYLALILKDIVKHRRGHLVTERCKYVVEHSTAKET